MSAAAGTPAREARDAGPFTVRAVAWMLGIGIFAFAALVVLATYAPDLRDPQDGGEHALSKSAVGFAGVAALMRERHAPVVVSRGRGRANGLLVLTPGGGASPEALKALKSNDAVLVVLPKWLAARDLLHRGWVRKMAPDAPGDIVPMLAEIAPGVTLERRGGTGAATLSGDGKTFGGRALATAPIDRFQTLKGGKLTPILTDERGGIVLGANGDASVYVLSDPDLLNTQGIKTLAGARTAAAILDWLRGDTGGVTFDVTLHGFERSRSLLKLAFEPPFLALTLCAVAAAGLMGWHAAVRFGPPVRGGRAFALGKRALADNSAALIRLAGHEHQIAPRYAALVRGRVMKALGAPKDLSLEQSEAFLDRIGRAKGVDDAITALDGAAKDARSGGDLLQVARRLHRWKLEMTRERR